jgi:hypothetical protein
MRACKTAADGLHPFHRRKATYPLQQPMEIPLPQYMTQQPAKKVSLPKDVVLCPFVKGLFTQSIWKRQRRGKMTKKALLKALND